MTSHENDSQSENPKTTSGPHRRRNWTVAGLAFGLIAGTGLGVAAASPFSAGASVDSEIVAEQAPHNQGHGPKAPMKRALQALVEDGTLTTSQLEAVIATLADARQGGRDTFRGAGPRAELLETAATFLEISPEELRADLQAGSTLAEIAERQGKSRDDVIAALLAGAIDSVTEKMEKFVPRLVDGEMGPRRTS